MPRSRTPRHLLAAGLAAAALTAAACADDGDGSRHASRSGGHSTFVEQGDRVLCDARHDLAGGVIGQVLGGDEPSADDVRRRFLAPYRDMRDGLARLTAPDADADAFAAAVRGLSAAIRSAERDPGLVLGDRDPFAPAEARLAELGLDGCA